MAVPALSILLPNYNHSAHLRRNLDSLLGQTFRDFELLIVDDGSTDDSVSLIESYAQRDSRIRFFRNEWNRGVIYSLNFLLSHARAVYVMGAAADDYYMLDYFAAGMDLLHRNPQAGVCLGLVAMVDEKGLLGCIAPALWNDKPAFMPPDELARRIGACIGSCGVCGPSIWKRQSFIDFGGYRPELRWHTDWFPLQVLAARQGACFLPQLTSVVRYVADSYSNGQKRLRTQRVVLQCLLRTMMSAEFSDTIPWFQTSGILRQFGQTLLESAITMDDHLAEAVRIVEPILHDRILDLLFDATNPGFQKGAARAIPLMGPAGWRYIDHLRHVARHAGPELSGIAAASYKTLIKQASTLRLAKYFSRKGVNLIVRKAKKILRPVLAHLYRRINWKLYQRLDHECNQLREQCRNFETEMFKLHKLCNEQQRKIDGLTGRSELAKLAKSA